MTEVSKLVAVLHVLAQGREDEEAKDDEKFGDLRHVGLIEIERLLS